MVKEQLQDLLCIHQELVQAKRTIERCEKELREQVDTMNLEPKKTYQFIHEGQLIRVHTHEKHVCPTIDIPEVINTEYMNEPKKKPAPIPAPRTRSFLKGPAPSEPTE